MPRRLDHVRFIMDIHLTEDLRLRDIGRDEHGQRQEPLLQRSDGFFIDEPRAAGGRHDRIDDDALCAMLLQAVRDRFDQRA